RRYWECLFIERPSAHARIHVGHYVVGLTYYLVTKDAFAVRHVLAMLLFAYATVHQHRCHRILAQLRPAATDTAYRVPHGDWFHHMSSPHYFAELLIYTALAIVLRMPPVWCCLLVWVTVNLGTTATNTHRWYRRKFDDYPAHRTAFLP
ncbi:3-oxo-5-alpha-steroid 4-dehydrogenase, partial [Thamnocephalis sphaerospora]